jgi:2-C-methyl-D-erythritol 2,4-cyclodiphosphate synthase
MSVHRIGYGHDIHRLVEGKKLVLGGVEIDHPMGLEGHSDGDVLTHAIVDSLLGAARLGDIGENFPPSSSRYGDISSVRLLELVKIKLAKIGYQIDNIDATVVCEEPRLDEIKDLMAGVIAQELEIEPEQVSVKATASQGLGFIGEKRGVAASAVSLISEIEYEEAEEESVAQTTGYEGEYDDEPDIGIDEDE